MGLNTKNSINLEEEDNNVVLNTDVTKPNEDEMAIMSMMC
jgi:hypothetical protein